jgi:uncharacterized transporter YbjL
VHGEDKAGRTAFHCARDQCAYIRAVVEAAFTAKPELELVLQPYALAHKLLLATIEGRSGQVQALLQKKAGVYATDVHGLTALHIASSDGHTKIVNELLRVGADKVVFPSRMQGERLGKELMRPNLLERLRLDDRNSIEEIKVPGSFVGRSLRELNLRKTYGISVLAAGQANQLLVNPPASLVLNDGELLVVMGPSSALETLPST